MAATKMDFEYCPGLSEPARISATVRILDVSHDKEYLNERGSAGTSRLGNTEIGGDAGCPHTHGFIPFFPHSFYTLDLKRLPVLSLRKSVGSNPRFCRMEIRPRSISKTIPFPNTVHFSG
jgi:hypothetical protein